MHGVRFAAGRLRLTARFATRAGKKRGDREALRTVGRERLALVSSFGTNRRPCSGDGGRRSPIPVIFLDTDGCSRRRWPIAIR